MISAKEMFPLCIPGNVLIYLICQVTSACYNFHWYMEDMSVNYSNRHKSSLQLCVNKVHMNLLYQVQKREAFYNKITEITKMIQSDHLNLKQIKYQVTYVIIVRQTVNIQKKYILSRTKRHIKTSKNSPLNSAAMFTILPFLWLSALLEILISMCPTESSFYSFFLWDPAHCFTLASVVSFSSFI